MCRAPYAQYTVVLVRWLIQLYLVPVCASTNIILGKYRSSIRGSRLACCCEFFFLVFFFLIKRSTFTLDACVLFRCKRDWLFRGCMCSCCVSLCVGIYLYDSRCVVFLTYLLLHGGEALPTYLCTVRREAYVVLQMARTRWCAACLDCGVSCKMARSRRGD